MSRNIGRFAEKRFSILCSDLGVTCNESVEDDHGWDHIVEFRQEPVTGVTSDMQRPLPPIFVQTKSHEASNRRVRMKFSNALELARHESPCFVVLMTQSADGISQVWQAVHFWGDLVGRVLQRAREASRDGIGEEEFHKRWFSFAMSEADVREEAELLSWMANTVRSVGLDYAAAKRALHPPPQLVGTISFGAAPSIEELVDHQLGLTPTIAVDAITLSTRRFGVDVPFPFPLPMGRPDFVRIHVHPSEQCEVWLRGPDGFEFELKGDVLAPAFPHLEDHQRKLRIRTFLLDIVWVQVGSIDFAPHIATTDRQSPTRIEQMVRLASWADQGSIDVRVNIRDQKVLVGTARVTGVPAQRHFAFLTGPISSLVQISRRLKANAPQISVMDLVESEWLVPFHNFLTTSEMNLKFSLIDDERVDDVSAGLAVAVAKIGSWFFAAVQRFPVVEQRQEGNLLAFKFGVPKLLEEYAFEISDEASIARMHEDFRRLKEEPGILFMDNVLVGLNKNLTQ